MGRAGGLGVRRAGGRAAGPARALPPSRQESARVRPPAAGHAGTLLRGVSGVTWCHVQHNVGTANSDTTLSQLPSCGSSSVKSN